MEEGANTARKGKQYTLTSTEVESGETRLFDYMLSFDACDCPHSGYYTVSCPVCVTTIDLVHHQVTISVGCQIRVGPDTVPEKGDNDAKDHSRADSASVA